MSQSLLSIFQLLIVLAISFCGLLVQAQFQTDTWVGGATGGTNQWSITNNWSVGGNPTIGVSTNGDALIFGLVSSGTVNPRNDFNATLMIPNLGVDSITFNTNSYALSGDAITLTNGITDNAGSNSLSLPIILGADQTFQNNSANQSTNTVSGAISPFTSTLTIGGTAPFFLTGAIVSTNGGALVINNSAVTRLGAVNYFGTNVIQITNLFTGDGTYTATTNVYTNYYIDDVAMTTNETYFTNIVSSTNGTTTYYTNTYAQVVNAVTINSGAQLQLNNAGGLPGGAKVGNLYFSGNGLLDLNGFSPTVSGLQDDGSGSAVVDNKAGTGTYTLTFGAGNSNAVFNGVIGTAANNGATSGSIGINKVGWGTEIIGGGNFYAGPTTVSQGTLKLSSLGSLGQYSSVLTIGSGAVLDVSVLGASGYQQTVSPTISAGTPGKPYTNFLGSYDPYYPTYVVSITGTNFVRTYQTNTDLATYTNVTVMTNYTTVTYSTNSIISVITNDVIGSVVVGGNGGVSPITSVAPGIATWSISGDLTLDNYQGIAFPNNLNRVFFVLNNTTTPGGGTNSLITVGGTLYVGDELDFVVTPFTGTLAAGTYTLIRAGSYVPHGNTAIDGDSDPANLVLIAPRGITGTFDTTSQPGNILLQASGTASPATVTWAGTPSSTYWDVHRTQNWTTNGVPDYFYAGDSVVFDDTGVGTVNIFQPVGPDSVTFNNNATNYTFVQNGSTFITGPGGLTKNGSGTVTLANPNSFTGDVTINNGTLALGYYDNTTFGQHVLYNGVPAGNLILGGGSINQNSQANVLPDTDFENLTINPGASAITQSGRSANELPVYEFSNNVTRAVGGVLNVTTSGRGGSKAGLYFESTNSPDGTNDYGQNGIMGGWAIFNRNDWLYANNANTTAAGGNMAYPYYQADNNPANWGATSNVLVSANTSSAVGTQTINSLKFNNTAAATVTINGSDTLTIASGGILIPSGGSVVNTITGGTLQGAAGQDLILLQNSIAGTLTINSVITDNGSATGLTTGGSGTIVLTGNNTYTGSTYINGAFQGLGLNPGSLQIGNGGASGSIASSSAVIDNGILSFNRSDDTSVNGIISGLGSLTQLGTGVLTLTANNTLSGLVTVSAGSLQLGNGGASGSVSNASAIDDEANLIINNNNNLGVSAPISGAGDLVQFGGGNLILAANETYSGNTVVSNGTLTLTASGSLSNTASIVVNSGAVLDASAAGGLTLRSLPAEVLAGGGTVNGSVTTANGSVLTPGTNGVVGTLTLNNNLTLDGGYFIFDVGTNGSDTIQVGGTLTETAGLVQVNPATGLTNGVYHLISATSGLSGSAANLAVYVPGLPSGQLAVLTNATANTLDLLVYSGIAPTVIWKGDSANNYWSASANSIWKDDLNNPKQYANADYVIFDDTGSTNPAVDLNVSSVYPNTITVNSTNNNYTIGSGGSDSANIISGGASLVKNGPGTLTLQSVNDYVVGTTINGGTVQLNGAGTSASADGMVGVGPVVNNGVLIANNVTNETLAGDISGSGLLVQQGSGTLVLAGNNTGFGGPVSVTNVLQVGNGVSGTFGTGDVTNNGSLVFNSPATFAVPGVISGSGSVSNLGTGTVTISGTNTYGGRTAIQAGTMVLGSGGALPASTSLQMDDNTSPNPVGALDLNGNDSTVAALQNASTGIGTASFEPSQIYNNGSGTNTLKVNGGGTYTYYGQLIDNNNNGSGRLALYVTDNTFLNLYPGYQSSSVFSINTFSGGLTISNATVHFGNGGQATDRNNGQHAAGTGMITLCGGLGADINGLTGMPTNGVLLPAQYGTSYNSGRSEYNTYPTIYVPAGQSGSIFMDGYGGLIFPLIGSGTLTIQPSYVRDQIGGDWSQFTGTIILQLISSGTYGTGQGGFTFTGSGTAGCPLGTMVIHTNNLAIVQASAGTAGPIFQIGALSGGDNTSELGGSAHGNGTKNGNRATIWVLGGANLDATNGSRFVDSDCGVRKVGTGTQVLTNNVMSFGGQCVVSNGTLAFAPLGNNDTGFEAQTNNFLVVSNFSLVDPGILDMSQAGGTLYLGNHRNNQTLFGSGTIVGNLQTQDGTNTLIAPAWGINGRPPTAGKLKVTGSVTINFPCTLNMYVYRTNGPTGGLTNDSIVANSATSPTIPTINSTMLNVLNGGDMDYAGQSTNVFPFFTGAVPVGPSSGITNITTFALPAGMFWVTNLDGSASGDYPTVPAGSMAIVNTNPSTFAFTAPPGITNLSFNGSDVVIQGDNGQANGIYYLRSSTNVALSLSNWTTVATNVLSANGAFTIVGTNAYVPGAPQMFYILDNTNQ